MGADRDTSISRVLWSVCGKKTTYFDYTNTSPNVSYVTTAAIRHIKRQLKKTNIFEKERVVVYYITREFCVTILGQIIELFILCHLSCKNWGAFEDVKLAN